MGSSREEGGCFRIWVSRHSYLGLKPSSSASNEMSWLPWEVPPRGNVCKRSLINLQAFVERVLCAKSCMLSGGDITPKG